MFRSLIALTCWLLLPSFAFAACSGQDLRPTLSEEERAELAARLEGTPYGHGIYWIARRGAQELHLVGTIHVEDARLAPIVAQLSPVISDAQLILAEATAAEQSALEKAITDRPELLFLKTGPTLPELLEETDWQSLAAAARARGIPPFMAAKFQPWYLSIMLSLPACMLHAAQTAQNGLDKQLLALAEAQGVPRSPLEPYDTLFSIMGDYPIEEQIEFLRLGILPDAASENALATLLYSYFEERTAEITEVSRITARRHTSMSPDALDRALDTTLEAVLVERNLAWMPIILDAPAGRTVVAVGAGHLPGSQGLLNLLAKEGFVLERQSLD